MVRQAILMSAIGGMIALSVPAQAQQRRVGNAAMGAATGLVVGGPVGAVAGGAIGFFEGENIARGMGIRHKHYRYRYTADGRRYRVYY
jgi:predicted MFS family arabinose efflux permease